NVSSVSATGMLAFNTAGNSLRAAGSVAFRNIRIISGHTDINGVPYGLNTGDFTVSHPQPGRYVLTINPPLANWLATYVDPGGISVGAQNSTSDPVSSINVQFMSGNTPVDQGFSFIVVGFQ